MAVGLRYVNNLSICSPFIVFGAAKLQCLAGLAKYFVRYFSAHLISSLADIMKVVQSEKQIQESCSLEMIF